MRGQLGVLNDIPFFWLYPHLSQHLKTLVSYRELVQADLELTGTVGGQALLGVCLVCRVLAYTYMSIGSLNLQKK